MASLLVLFLVATVSTAFGLTVTPCGNLDVPRRLSSAVFDSVDGDTVYILGGIMENDTAPANPILKYTISTQKVEPLVLPIKPKKMLHGAAAYRHGATPNDFEIYYIGGGEVYNDTFYDAIYKILPLQTTGPVIEQVGRLPVGLAASTAHVVTTTNEYEPGPNDWIYIFGGENIMTVDSVYRFGLDPDHETPVATEFHRLKYPLTRAASVLMLDPDLSIAPHQVYFFGGNKNSSGVTLHAEEVLMYDTVGTNTLTGIRLVDGVESPVAVSDGKIMWVIGGYIGGSYSNQRFTEFNLTANTAQEVCVTEEYRILPQEASAVYAKDKIIIFGGYTNLTTDAILCIDTTALNRVRCPPEDDDSGTNSLSSIAYAVVLVFLVSIRNNMF